MTPSPTPSADAASDGRDTRARLLDAAEPLFAQRGFAGVSVRDIASAAGVNVAAVNYHFQGKQSLYHAVLRRVVAAKRDRYLAAIRAAASAPGASLDDLVASFYRVHFEDTLKTAQGGNFVKLLVRELHHGGAEGARILEQMLLPMWQEVSRRVLDHVPGADPARADWIAGSLHGQLTHFTMRWHKVHDASLPPGAARTFRSLFPPLAGDVDAYIDAAVAHITRFSVAGIRAVADLPAPAPPAGERPDPEETP